MTDEWTLEHVSEVSRGFMKSRVIITAAELDLFSHLAENPPMTAEDLARIHCWDVRGLTILMDALAAQGLLLKGADATYRVPETVTRFLTRKGSETILPLVLHSARMWQSWSHLTQIVKTGHNPNPMGLASRSDEDLESFIGAMHVIGKRLADQIVADIDVNRFSHLLDVGGGSGVYTISFLKKAPQLEATLFDLPRVITIAERFLAQEGFRTRVNLVAGDYHQDPLPTGYDVALLSAVIHINSREENERLFRKVYQALLPGGTIIIRDHIMSPCRTEPADGALFAVNMLVATRGGSTYTFEEIREDLEAAGFTRVRLIRQGERMDQVVEAIRPL